MLLLLLLHRIGCKIKNDLAQVYRDGGQRGEGNLLVADSRRLLGYGELGFAFFLNLIQDDY